MKEFFELFRKPSAKVIAQREMEEARRMWLAAQDAAEYHARMVQYHAERIRRLKAFLLVEE